MSRAIETVNINIREKTQNAGKGRLPIYAVSPGYQALGMATSDNPTALLKAYRGWVAACVDAIADDCAEVKLRFFDSRNDEELSPDHPVVKLFLNPCPELTRFMFKKLIYTWMELEGDAFLYKAKNQLGVTAELWPIMPDRMFIVPDDNMLVKGFLYRYMGQQIAFERSEIVHIKYPSPANLHRGMGTLEKAAYEYDTEFYLKKFRIGVFKNRGRPDAVLETEQDLEPDDIERIKENWHKAYGSIDNVGKMAILSMGLTYKQIQINPHDLDYLQGARATRDDILGIFRVPAAKLGLVEDVNRANGYELERTFQKDVIKPKLTLVREQLQKDIIDEFDERIEARHDDNVPQDIEFNLKQEDTDVRNAVQTINELRASRGLEPVPWGDKPWVPFNMVQIGSSFLPQPAGEEKTVKLIPGNFQRSESEEEIKTGLWRAYLTLHEPLANSLERAVIPLFKDQRGYVLRNLKKAFEKNIRVKRDPLIIDFVLFSLEEAEKIFAEVADPHLREILLAGLRKGFSDLKIDIEPMIGERLNKWLDIRKEKFSFEVNDTTLRSLKEELTVGMDAGESIDLLSARVNKVFDFAEGYRARRIAVTETTCASNKGILQAFTEAPLDMKKMWLTARDGNERDWHGTMDSQERELIEPFESGRGNALMYPGDPDCSDSSELCNCRCSLLARKK